MGSPRAGSKKGSRNAASDGPAESLKRSKIDTTSDSASLETGDEAHDDRTASGKVGVEENQRSDVPPDVVHKLDDRSWSSAPHADVEQKLDDRSWRSDPHPVRKLDARSSHSAPHRVSISSQDLIYGAQASANAVQPSPLSDQQKEAEYEARSDPPPLSSRSVGNGRLSENDGDYAEGDDHAQEDDDDSDPEISQKPDSLLWRSRMLCGSLVNHEYVQISIICLIILNAVMMGLATMDAVTDNEVVDLIFSSIDQGFLVIFTVEVAMQLFYLGVTLFADGWLVFDLLIVILSWSFESLQIVRAFRIFRAFRLVTRVKPLRDLVLAVGAVLPRMYAIAALLLLIFYIFSVLFTELFSDLPLADNYFKTLDMSLFTCMEMMTLEWGEIAREVMLYHSWAWAPFTAFILITGFIVFNLIVAVVCDAVADTEKTVRKLDGFESDNPTNMLVEAQERIDLLHCHINDMLRTQESVQSMIESMAGELLHLEAEKMKSEHREAELRIEVERRLTYEHDMQSKQQLQSLERNYTLEKERRESERRVKDQRRKSTTEHAQQERLGHLVMQKRGSEASSIGKRSVHRRGSEASSTGRRSLSARDLSFRAGSRTLEGSTNSGSSHFSEADKDNSA
jgi:hypothetical protein